MGLIRSRALGVALLGRTAEEGEQNDWRRIGKLCDFVCERMSTTAAHIGIHQNEVERQRFFCSSFDLRERVVRVSGGFDLKPPMIELQTEQPARGLMVVSDENATSGEGREMLEVTCGSHGRQ